MVIMNTIYQFLLSLTGACILFVGMFFYVLLKESRWHPDPKLKESYTQREENKKGE